jgi:hypothetical protein
MWPYLNVSLEGHIRQLLYIYDKGESLKIQREI